MTTLEHPPGPRPLRRDAELNRQRIIDAAEIVFGERGLDATLDDVAHAAGVGVGTVYRRFAGKEELIDALFEQKLAEIESTVAEGLADPDPWHGFVRCFERTSLLMASNRGLREVALSSGHGQQRVATARERIKAPYEKLMRRAQAAGQLREDLEATDLPVLQLMIGSGAEYTKHVQPDVWRRYFELILDGMRARRDGPTPLPTSALSDPEVEQAMRSWQS